MRGITKEPNREWLFKIAFDVKLLLTLVKKIYTLILNKNMLNIQKKS